MPTVSAKLSAILLVGLCLNPSAAEDSEICSDGVCAAKTLKEQLKALDVFDQAKELSLIQLTSMEQRAQDTGASAGEETSVSWLDAAYKRKGESSDPAPVPAPAPEAKDTSDSKASDTKKDDVFSDGVDGCCDGKREEATGMLWRDNVTSLDACKAKCRSFKQCSSIEYGWKDMPNWCAIWDTTQECKKMDKSCKESVPGNGKGVKNYKYTVPKPSPELAKSKWNVVGDGCCAGERNETNGKLYADKEDNLDACKTKCLQFDNCGIVEYGWKKGDPQWCYIWDDSQKCEKQDKDCTASVLGSGEGAKAHKFMKA